jgi:putative colanic acid biosynthesis UDP-glucose lipid carrier transferase
MQQCHKSYVVKYAADKIFALGLCCFFIPLWLLIAIGMIIEGLFFPESRGPLFVVEPRISEGKEFQLYKLRKVKKKILDAAKHKKSGTYSVTELQRNPENLTIVGRVLKKFYLDESAQILNVLKGDLSFVGPRPHISKIYDEELKHGIVYEKIMRCGLTGLVAVNKDLKKNKDILDTEYYERYSTYSPWRLLLYDAWIILQTLGLIVRAKGY